jgi:hypothetical protein
LYEKQKITTVMQYIQNSVAAKAGGAITDPSPDAYEETCDAMPGTDPKELTICNNLLPKAGET